MTMHADHDTAIRAALAQVRDDMRAGVIRPNEFDMEFWDCGTTACIGGHLQRRVGKDAMTVARQWDERLGRLFYPDPLNRPFDEASAAIDRYLAGDEPWPATMETTNVDQ